MGGLPLTSGLSHVGGLPLTSGLSHVGGLPLTSGLSHVGGLPHASGLSHSCIQYLMVIEVCQIEEALINDERHVTLSCIIYRQSAREKS